MLCKAGFIEQIYILYFFIFKYILKCHLLLFIIMFVETVMHRIL